MEWISTECKLPKNYVECLVFTIHYDGTGHREVDYINEYGEWELNSKCKVTHWMYLPDEPKID